MRGANSAKLAIKQRVGIFAHSCNLSIKATLTKRITKFVPICLKVILRNVQEDEGLRGSSEEPRMENLYVKFEFNILRPLDWLHGGHHGLVVLRVPQIKISSCGSLSPSAGGSLEEFHVKGDSCDRKSRTSHREQVEVTQGRHWEVGGKTEVVVRVVEWFFQLFATILFRFALGVHFLLAAIFVSLVSNVARFAFNGIALETTL